VRPDAEFQRHTWPAERREAALRAAATALEARPEVLLAYAHGSFAADRPFRDLDLAILLRHAASWRDPGRIAQAVWEAIGKPPFDIDVQILNEAGTAFRLQVAESGRPIFQRHPGEATEFRVLARNMDFELREWRRLRAEEK
jgi:predicted nucleotidyltransferase